MSTQQVTIQISPCAEEVLKSAAAQLKEYLHRLFGTIPSVSISSEPVQIAGGARILIGTTSDDLIQKTSGGVPKLTDQGYLLRRVSPDTLVLCGGSGSAAAWAVYDLAERFGVRYLLHGDVIPPQRNGFSIPALDELCEPLLRIRSWRLFNDLAHGPLLWTLDQQKLVINQVFKLRYNSILLGIWPQHPLLVYEYKGVKRSRWTLLFGQKIPIGDDNIGREHLWDDMPFLTHPVLRGVQEFACAHSILSQHLNSVIDHAQALGMHTCISFQPLEFPKEFRHLLEKPTTERIQLGDQVCAERGNLSNPGHIGLIETRFRAFIEQWGRADEVAIGIPEHPHADMSYRTAWQRLVDKHKLGSEYDVDALLAETKAQHLTSGGAQRTEREFKSIISMLQFFDELFSQGDLLNRLEQSKMKLKIGVGTSAGGLVSLVHRVLPPGSGLSVGGGYTSSRTVRRLGFLERVDTDAVEASLTLTLQDDNIGWLPQVATESNHVLLQFMIRNGWHGYTLRFWPIGDLDPPAAYLAQASWRQGMAVRTAYEDHFGKVYGEEAIDPFCQVMRLLEDASVILDLDFLSLLFPVHGVVSRRLASNTPMADGLYHILAQYKAALSILTHTTSASGRGDFDYWVGRLKFGIGALEHLSLIHQAGIALHAWKDVADSNPDAARGHREQAEALGQQAIAAAKRALQAMATNIRDDSDRTSLAAYYHFMVREVQEELQEALAG